MSSGSTSTVDAQVILLETRFYMLNSISKPILWWCFNLFFFCAPASRITTSPSPVEQKTMWPLMNGSTVVLP